MCRSSHEAQLLRKGMGSHGIKRDATNPWSDRRGDPRRARGLLLLVPARITLSPGQVLLTGPHLEQLDAPPCTYLA